ncbi:MAG: hypothetical protein PHU63_02620 [Candidatus ainarchaeum sp.]|nr:hypothetical protein [Candidatus ainarchaeum sp.]
MKIISSKSISIPEVQDILSKREKDGEIEYEQQNAVEYCTLFSKSSKSDSEKTIKELIGNYSLDRETAIKIVDIAPKNIDLLKTILLKDKIELKEEELVSIVKMFSK